jgi:hypothetical protein
MWSSNGQPIRFANRKRLLQSLFHFCYKEVTETPNSGLGVGQRRGYFRKGHQRLREIGYESGVTIVKDYVQLSAILNMADADQLPPTFRQKIEQICTYNGAFSLLYDPFLPHGRSY